MHPTLIPLAALPFLAVTGERHADESRLERVAVLGASISSGYGLDDELEADADLALVVECMLRSPQPVLSSSDMMFFQTRDVKGPELIRRVVDREATLVIAIDFLFWYGYGVIAGGADARLERLERGIEMLDKLECPIMIGDFPDLSMALEGAGLFGRPMLSKDMLPAPETLDRLNERVRAWAKKRADVLVIPFASFLRQVQAGEEIELRGNVLPENFLPRLMQPDLLHTTVEGTIAITVLAFDYLERARDDVSASDIEWDMKKIRKAVEAGAIRKRDEERERRDNERKKKREERRKKEREGSGTFVSRAA